MVLDWTHVGTHRVYSVVIFKNHVWAYNALMIFKNVLKKVRSGRAWKNVFRIVFRHDIVSERMPRESVSIRVCACVWACVLSRSVRCRLMRRRRGEYSAAARIRFAHQLVNHWDKLRRSARRRARASERDCARLGRDRERRYDSPATAKMIETETDD